jgi:competence protein ComGC
MDHRGFPQQSRAFSLIELIVSIGVLMVLVSLLVPALARSSDRARTVRDMATMRQNSAAIAAYTSDYQDIHPIAFSTASQSASYWYQPLVARGYIGTVASVDPSSHRRTGGVMAFMSVCMVMDPDLMLPGRTRPFTTVPSYAVRLASVPYPSLKGQVFKMGDTGLLYEQGGRYLCCQPPYWRAPIAMCDGSTLTASMLELNGGTPPLIVDHIGAPVWTSWGGYAARDR